MENLPTLQALLATPKKVVIVTHFKPDADALGSSLGLANFLVKKGHNVSVISPSDYPDFLAWMPGKEMVLALSKENKEAEKQAAERISQADVIFCLDFSSLKRIHEVGPMVAQSTATKVMVDHHLEPEDFTAFKMWDVSSASTAQLIFGLIDDLGDQHLMDANIATCLYAGLMTDTGGFRHNNTTHREFLVAASLVSKGANPSLVAKEIYDTNSLERLRLTGFALSEKLVVLREFNTAYMT
ncbi:MAG: DHH family phosphoesterase, partial [Flammeovirgaceae bacterium]